MLTLMVIIQITCLVIRGDGAQNGGINIFTSFLIVEMEFGLDKL